MLVQTPCGEFINKISIEAVTGKEQAATGEITDVWTEQFTAWAKLETLHGRNVEIALARTKGKSISHQVTMRYVKGIEPVKKRIKYHGRVFEIFSVVNKLERNLELEILCNEITA